MSSDDGEAGEKGQKRVLLADYAARYDADLRTIKRWRAKGVEVGDATPLEDPERMMGWWQKWMKMRVPPGITAAVVMWRKAGKSTVLSMPPEQKELAMAAMVPAKSPAKDPERQATVDAPVDAEEIGLDQTLKRLGEMEVRLSRVATDPGQTKAWLDTISRMSSAAEKLRLESERMGKLIPRDKAETMIHEFHQPVEREIRLLYRTMCEITGLPATPETEALWCRECDRLFSRFSEEVFR